MRRDGVLQVLSGGMIRAQHDLAYRALIAGRQAQQLIEQSNVVCGETSPFSRAPAAATITDQDLFDLIDTYNPWNEYSDQGIEPYTDPIPIQPTAHYAMGGIPTNIKAEVLSDNKKVVPGLYAAGECACVSVHGANRLGTNSLLDINVFGKRAGIYAVEYAKTADFVPLPEDPAGPVREMIEHVRNAAGTERVPALRKELQEQMDRNAQVFRTEESLSHAQKIIEGLRKRYEKVGIHDRGQRFNTDLLEAIELGFLLDLAAWGVREPAELAWLDPPPAPALREARALLVPLGAFLS